MPRDIATAQTELEQARATLATLQEQVRDGNDSVTPDQLTTQKELVAFAGLRVEAAQRTETRLREEERAAVGAAALQAAQALVTGPSMDELAAATRAAVDAIAHLADLVHARNAQIAEIGTTLEHLDDDLRQAGVATGPWGSKRYGLWGDRRDVLVPGTGQALHADLGSLTATVVMVGLGVTPASEEAQRRHVDVLNAPKNAVVRRTLEQHPRLAEELRATLEEFEAADGRGKAILSEQGRHPQG